MQYNGKNRAFSICLTLRANTHDVNVVCESLVDGDGEERLFVERNANAGTCDKWPKRKFVDDKVFAMNQPIAQLT